MTDQPVYDVEVPAALAEPLARLIRVAQAHGWDEAIAWLRSHDPTWISQLYADLARDANPYRMDEAG